jgi:hypothetical protein
MVPIPLFVHMLIKMAYITSIITIHAIILKKQTEGHRQLVIQSIKSGKKKLIDLFFHIFSFFSFYHLYHI